MITLHTSLRRPPRWLAVPAVLILCLTPAVLRAETVLFRNDCRAAVTVQATSVVKGVIKRDQYLLRAADTTPKLKLEYDKLITVTDPRTGRLLFREVLRVSKKPVAYSIVVDRNTGRLRMVPNKALLVAPPTGGGGEMSKPEN